MTLSYTTTTKFSARIPPLVTYYVIASFISVELYVMALDQILTANPNRTHGRCREGKREVEHIGRCHPVLWQLHPQPWATHNSRFSVLFLARKLEDVGLSTSPTVQQLPTVDLWVGSQRAVINMDTFPSPCICYPLHTSQRDEQTEQTTEDTQTSQILQWRQFLSH